MQFERWTIDNKLFNFLVPTRLKWKNGGRILTETPTPAITETIYEIGKLLHRNEAVDCKFPHTKLRGFLKISSLLDKCSSLLDVDV